jgi:hypothetical protein
MDFAAPLHEDVSFDIGWSFYNLCWYNKPPLWCSDQSSWLDLCYRYYFVYVVANTTASVV